MGRADCSLNLFPCSVWADIFYPFFNCMGVWGGADVLVFFFLFLPWYNVNISSPLHLCVLVCVWTELICVCVCVCVFFSQCCISRAHWHVCFWSSLDLCVWTELKTAVGQIIHTDRYVLAVEQNKVLVPPNYSRYLAWGFADLSLRVGPYESEKVSYTLLLRLAIFFVRDTVDKKLWEGRGRKGPMRGGGEEWERGKKKTTVKPFF